MLYLNNINYVLFNIIGKINFLGLRIFEYLFKVFLISIFIYFYLFNADVPGR